MNDAPSGNNTRPYSKLHILYPEPTNSVLVDGRELLSEIVIAARDLVEGPTPVAVSSSQI